ncbi:hypothetical protein EKO04_007726 [Ascochyta lentis]|uniref:Amino acid transporter transmembrane domain-containing protein n=1 Tax=Ascochyta lentis TaxID=205686 RepID=A0A8H7MGG2_9PLEO|nr:hypothetical protein EKO04_007726 [Ascochyta lentis]
MAKVGGLAGEESRLSVNNGSASFFDGRVRPQHRKLYDPSVSFEEYLYYAEKTRVDQKATDQDGGGQEVSLLKIMFPPKSSKVVLSEKMANLNTNIASQRAVVSNEEWINASKAMRNATGMAVFYLLTTDVLGPFGLPYAVATTGWGPSVSLYTVFGAMAAFSGSLLWHCFMYLDSYEYPVLSYSDLAFRIYGSGARYVVLCFQAVQMLLNVAVILISNGESLSQASRFRLCYAVCVVVWAIAGFLFGQIRTLQKFGFLANIAIWINLLIMFITMGVAANSPPLYSSYTASAGYSVNPILVTPNDAGEFPPVTHSAGLPDGSNFAASINGLMNAVYAYSGTQIFIDFMAEMSRPQDFLKSMWSSQFFIYACYMVYGLFMYSYQGQYVQNPSYLGISPYTWSTVGNSLAMVTAAIAAALYGNIGLKVIYNSVGVQIFNAPPLYTKTGKYIWAGIVPVYWSVAYVIGGAIPAFSGFVAFVSALCAMQFSYSFPPLLHVGFMIQKNAKCPDEGFDPTTGPSARSDSGFKRIMRGFFAKRWYINIFNILYCLGALVCAGLGMWASIENLIAVYAIPQLNAFTCTSPLNAPA